MSCSWQQLDRMYFKRLLEIYVASEYKYTVQSHSIIARQQNTRKSWITDFTPVCNSIWVYWYLLVFIVEQNLVGILNVTLIVFYSRLGIHKNTIEAICKNMASSTKPEVRNILQCCQETTEPRPWAACTKIWWSRVVFELCEWTNRRIIRHTNNDIHTPPGAKYWHQMLVNSFILHATDSSLKLICFAAKMYTITD